MEQLQERPKVFKLSWEEKRIGIKASKVNLTNKLRDYQWDELIEEFNNYELVVINNEGNDSKNNLLIGKLDNSFVADINVQFEKVPSKIVEEKFNNVEINNNKKYDEDIVRIAEKSFVYSRFTIDPNFKNENAKLIYVDWTKNSFNQEDKYFVTCSLANRSIGYIIFSIDNKIATIELVAVDKRYQNMKIGKKMMIELERYIYEMRKEVSLIKVGTQSENETAIRFYQSRGFKLVKINTIYHHWKK